MDILQYNAILILLISVITFLIGIIGWFIMRFVNKQDETNEKLFKLAEDQQAITNQLTILITQHVTSYESHKDVCKEHFKRIEGKSDGNIVAKKNSRT